MGEEGIGGESDFSINYLLDSWSILENPDDLLELELESEDEFLFWTFCPECSVYVRENLDFLYDNLLSISVSLFS